jgi:hypothetical protein
MAYRHNDTLHKHKVREKKVRKFVFFTVFLAFIISAIIAGDYLWGRLTNKSVVSNISTSTVQSATVNIFRTPYYQFQADDSWSEVVDDEEEDTKYVYRSMNGPLVEHQLTVYVNDPNTKKYAATRVLPVELLKGRFKQVAELGSHCNSDVPEGQRLDELVLTYNQVTFNCNLDSNVFRVFVGVIGGTNEIEAIRPDGKTAVYTIIYDDLRYLPNGSQIDSIIETFQIR